MQARYSALTRYEMLPNGVLKVRRVVLTGEISNQPDGGRNYDVYFREEWNPFKVNDASFNAFALSLDDANGIRTGGMRPTTTFRTTSICRRRTPSATP